MLLENLTLNTIPIETFLNSLSAALVSIVDNSTPNNLPLFQSVAFGVDAVLQSAMNGKPNVNDCPLARIFWDPYTINYQNNANTALYVNLPVDIYILFALDQGNQSNFQILRERFVHYVLDYIKYGVYAVDNNRGMQYNKDWKWNVTNAPITHDTTFRIVGKQIDVTPKSNFSVTKISLNAMIKNYG